MQNASVRIRRGVVDLNLFKSGIHEGEVLRYERWSTRLYLLLLIIGVMVLLIYTALGTETVQVVVNNPSLETFETLQVEYAATLKCPCSQIAVRYERFLQIEPVYHQICSSSFVTQEWIVTTYGANVSNIWPMDVRTVISAHAQFLRTFCDNTQRGIAYVLNGIVSSSLISAEALSYSLVQQQVNIQEEAVRSAGKWQLTVLITFMRLTMSSSHLMTGFGTNSFLYMISNDSSVANVGINSYQLDSSSAPCYCLTMSNCPVPGAIYPTHQLPTFGSFNVETLGIGGVPIQGIQVGCFALESVLASTLECYYNSSCIDLLVTNSGQFSPLQPTSSDYFSPNTTIETLVNQLMVEKWLVNMSYTKYYAECAPKTCTYSFNQRNNFLIIFTTIAALIGGLSSILRLFIPWIIRIITQIKQKIQSRNNHVQRVVVVWTEQRSTLNKMKEKFVWLWLKIKMLNLFDSKSNNALKEKYERYTTRLYIICVTIAFVILLCYTIVKEETTVYTIEKPSQDTYEKLYAQYSDTLECACNKISIPYSEFITIQANYHQACSSLFISPDFFAQLAAIKRDTPIYPGDFILMGVEYFQWLTTFCSLSQLVFYNQLIAFQSKLYVNNKLLTPNTFEVQASELADVFISDVQYYFSRGIKQMREILGFSQPLSATSNIMYKLPITTTSSGSQIRIVPANFFSGCSCLSDPTSCSDDAAFYSYNPMNNTFYSVFKVSGVRIACSPIESFLQSSLDCWYSSQCYQTVIEYWEERTYYLEGIPPVLNNTISSRYNSSTPLHLIIDQLMVEDWSKEISYEKYLSNCDPLYCTYSVSERRNVILIVTVLLGLFGGLNVVLKLLTPLLIKLATWFIRHGQECSMSFRRYFREIPSKLIAMNLFYNRHESSESTVKQERHSTRLYIILLILIMLALLFYYSLSQSVRTVLIKNPSEEIYEKLQKSNEISSLQCPCRQVSISYGKFVEVNISLHEICSSSFISQSWIKSILGNDDWANLNLTDFNGRGVIYFQGLSSLCYLFQENLTHYASYFLSSSFISAQVLSENELISQVNQTIEHVEASNRGDHSSMYTFARNLESDNQLMTIYSSNWIYAPIKYDPNLIGLPIPLIPLSHGNCSCSVSFECIQPVILNEQIVPGFVLGCLPFESLFRSTLVCLYNQSCINQINIHNLSVVPLIPPLNNQLSINRTIGELVDNVLDQQWSFNISYSKFYSECQPATCSYSINQHRDIVQIIVTLLGLYGGLTVALRFLVPYIIAFIHRIILKFRQLKNDIHPQNPERY